MSVSAVSTASTVRVQFVLDPEEGDPEVAVNEEGLSLERVAESVNRAGLILERVRDNSEEANEAPKQMFMTCGRSGAQRSGQRSLCGSEEDQKMIKDSLGKIKTALRLYEGTKVDFDTHTLSLRILSSSDHPCLKGKSFDLGDKEAVKELQDILDFNVNETDIEEIVKTVNTENGKLRECIGKHLPLEFNGNSAVRILTEYGSRSFLCQRLGPQQPSGPLKQVLNKARCVWDCVRNCEQGVVSILKDRSRKPFEFNAFLSGKARQGLFKSFITELLKRKKDSLSGVNTERLQIIQEEIKDIEEMKTCCEVLEHQSPLLDIVNIFEQNPSFLVKEKSVGRCFADSQFRRAELANKGELDINDKDAMDKAEESYCIFEANRLVSWFAKSHNINLKGKKATGEELGIAFQLGAILLDTLCDQPGRPSNRIPHLKAKFRDSLLVHANDKVKHLITLEITKGDAISMIIRQGLSNPYYTQKEDGKKALLKLFKRVLSKKVFDVVTQGPLCDELNRKLNKDISTAPAFNDARKVVSDDTLSPDEVYSGVNRAVNQVVF